VNGTAGVGTAGTSVTDSAFPEDKATVTSQLLTQNGRALQSLQTLSQALDTPATRTLLGKLRDEATTDAEAAVEQVLAKLEGLLQAVHYCQSELRRELESSQGSDSLRDRDHLPGALGRFITERESSPGFSWETFEDPIRGWVVKWKQMTAAGTVRGAGQLWEKPYAWMDD